MAEISVVRLNRFPVKGMSAEPLKHMDLTSGDGVPGDRLFGFARHDSGFDPDNPRPLPKIRFVVLVKEAALAGLKTDFDHRTGILEIAAPEGSYRFETHTDAGRTDAAQTLHRLLELTDPAPPVFVSSAPHRFTDVSVASPQMMNAISVLNLSSVRALADRLGVEIDPARFRANVEIDGLPGFTELDAVGEVLSFGDVGLRILARTRRCAATEVNPVTAERDLKLPYLLRRELGHTDMGVYAEVISGGRLSVGQSGSLLS